jgi:hypothetical protein
MSLPTEIEVRLLRTVKDARQAGDMQREVEAMRLLKEGQNLPDRQQQLAEAQNPLEAAAIGAGRAFTELGRGVGELAGLGGPRDPAEEAGYAALQKASPIATALGESVPYVAAGLAAGGAPGLGMSMARQAGASGLVGLAQPGSLSERVQRGGIDAIAGGVGEGIGRALGRAVAPGLRPAYDDALANMRGAERGGFQALPSSLAGPGGSRLRQSFEGGLESTPGGAMVLDKVTQHNLNRLGEAAAEEIGLGTDHLGRRLPLTGPNVGAARAEIGQGFRTLMPQGRPFQVDDTFRAELDRIADESVAPFLRGEQDPVGVTLSRLREKIASGEIDAADLMAQQSRLGKQGRAALRGENSNPELGHGLLDIQENLLDLARRNMQPEEGATLDALRRRYRILSTIESGQNWDPVTGQLYPGRLASHLQRRDRYGFSYGNDDSPFYQGVRFLGRQQKQLQSSGTAERQMMNRMMASAAGAGIGLAGGTSVFENDVVGGGLGALVGATLLPGVAARAYISPMARNYMTRELGTTGQNVARGIGLTAAQSAAAPLREAQSMATSMGAENLARELATINNRVNNGTATQQDIDRGKHALVLARERALAAQEYDLASALKGLIGDTNGSAD